MKYDIIHIKSALPDFKHLIEIEVFDSNDFLHFFNKFGSESDFLLIVNDNNREFFVYPYRNYIFKTETKGYKSLSELEVGVINGCLSADDFYNKEAVVRGYESVQQYFEAHNLGFIDSLDTIQTRFKYYLYHDEQIQAFLDISNEGNFYKSVVTAGFKNFHDFDDAINKGFKTSFAYYMASESGFNNAHDFEEASQLGFTNEREFNEAKKQGFYSKTEINFIKWREKSGVQGNKLDEDFLYYILKFEIKDRHEITSSELYKLFNNKLSEVFGIKFTTDYSRHPHTSGISSDKDRDKYRKLYKKSIHYKEDIVFILTEKTNISEIAVYDSGKDVFIFKK